MFSRFSRALIHLLGFALVCAVAAHWIIKIVTPAPSAAPAPVAGPAPRDVDPVLAARMFGLVQLAQQAPVIANVQVAGVFAAGRDSAAVLVVDNKQARAYLLGQEVSPGSKLVAVRRDGVTLEANGARQDLNVSGQPTIAALGGAAPPPAFAVKGGVLSAPSQEGGVALPPPTRSLPSPAQRGNMPLPPPAQVPQPPPGMPPGAMPPVVPAPSGASTQ